jgi:putative DNA primase/helicase
MKNGELRSSINFARENQISTIPVCNKSKIPQFAWKEYQERLPTEEEITRWFGEAECNIGFVCGDVSGPAGYSLIVADYDCKAVFDALCPNGSATRGVITARGAHLYFFVPGKMSKFKIEIDMGGTLTGVDVQGQGAYVLAPGSIHPSGVPYTWLNDNPIAKLDGETPEHFKQVLLTKLDVVCQKHGWKLKTNIEHDVEKYLLGVPAGSRNQTGYVVAAYCRRLRLTREDALVKLAGWNAKNSPPLSEREVQDIVASAYKKDAKIGFVFKDMPMGDFGYLKYVSGKKILIHLIAQDIMEEHIFITSRDTEELLHYENGIYRPLANTIVNEWFMERISPISTERRCKEVCAQIQAKTYVDRTQINSNNNHIPMENGIFDLETGELLPFDPKHFITWKLNIVYDPDADCPAIKKFLSEVLVEEDIPVIIEFFGYCLLKEYSIQKSFMLVGEGANGKSTLLALLKTFLGPENISSRSIQELEKNRFATSTLYGKLANLYSDLSHQALRSTGIFKMLTGGDTMSAEKKFKDSFEFMNYAKLIFSCNTLPPSPDDTNAFMRRWIFINFPNAFIGKKADKKLITKLTTPEELSGLFNLAVLGLKRLLMNGDFSYSATIEETRARYVMMSDSLHAFILTHVVQEPEALVHKDHFFIQYREFCILHKLPVKDKAFVGRLLPKHCSVDTFRNESGRHWKGIAIRNKDSDDDSQDIQGIHDTSLSKWLEEGEGEDGQ